MSDVTFEDSYFEERNLNDSRRVKSFELEKKFLEPFTTNCSNVLDIGCSTGEFLRYLGLNMQASGIEINELAARTAASHGIRMYDRIEDIDEKFDLIIFRGVIQHLSNPFETLINAARLLTPEGSIAILSTPNCDSLYFRIFNSLPALDKPKCYLFPTLGQIANVLDRQDLRLEKVSYPYLQSGYARLSDFMNFFMRLLTRNSRLQSAFPRNMMNLIFQKRPLGAAD